MREIGTAFNHMFVYVGHVSRLHGLASKRRKIVALRVMIALRHLRRDAPPMGDGTRCGEVALLICHLSGMAGAGEVVLTAWHWRIAIGTRVCRMLQGFSICLGDGRKCSHVLGRHSSASGVRMNI